MRILRSLSREKDALRRTAAVFELLRQIHEGTQAFKVRQDCTFVDQQDDDAREESTYPLGAWEYHSSMKLIESSEKKPLRIFTHVSEFDLRAKDAEETYHNWVMANRRTADALKAKGYDYRFVFSYNSKHCDGNVYDHTLADTLIWMWRGYHE